MKNKTTHRKAAQKEQRIDIIRPGNPGVTFFEALELTKGKRLISNLEADALLQNKETYNQYRDLFRGGAWTSTMYAYEEEDTTLGEEIVTPYFSFKVPKKYQGETNIVLVFSLYDCTISGIGTRKQITLNKNAKVIAHEMQYSEGWYLPNPLTGIPTGKESDSSDPKARYLIQRDNEAWIGPLVRWDDGWDFDDGRRVVDAYWGWWPDGRRGVGVVVGAKTRQGKKGKVHRCNCRYCTQKGDIED